MIWQTSGERESNFTMRARYQLGFKTPAFDILFKNGVYLTGSMEFFWNLQSTFSDNFVNRIRLDLGAGTKVSDRWHVQLHYLLQDGRGVNDSLFRDIFDSEEHILRLRLTCRFN
jgi:hypothetical protein